MWAFDNNLPIYSQIVTKIKKKIISGEYKIGEKLPSVREFALEIGVNPNTMQRAFAELEGENLVQTQRTAGRYITSDEEIIKTLKREIAQKTVEDFLKSMQDLNIDKDEIISMVEKIYKK